MSNTTIVVATPKVATAQKGKNSRKKVRPGPRANSHVPTKRSTPRKPYIPAVRTRMRNRLLETYLDPERYPGVRYPDNYSRATATAQLIDVFNPFVFPTGSVVEPAGSYYNIVRASIVHPLWAYGCYPCALPFLALSEQTDRFGVRPLTAGGLCPSIQDNQGILQAGVKYNLAMPKCHAVNDWIEDPYLLEDINGNAYYGHTLAFGTTIANVKPTFTISAPVALGDKLTIEFTNGSIFISEDIVAAAVGQSVFIGTNRDLTTLCVLDNVNSLGLCCGRTAPIGIRVKWVPVAVTNIPSAVMVSAYLSCQGGATPPTNQIGLFPSDFKNQKDFLENMTTYRPVSSSLWTSFVGATLADGGQHACITYRGGGHPNQIKLYNLKLISETRESFADKVRLGSYQFWIPANTRDTEMRLPVNSDEWEHPIMVMAGLMGNTTVTNPLNLRVVANFEFTSSSSIWAYSTVRPNPQMISAAASLLGGIPTSMSNDSHLENIYNWLKGAAKSTFEWYGENKHWIVPALAAGVALL